jgi:hypothetical protein
LFVLNGALRASVGQVSDTPADLAVHSIVDHSRPLRSQPLPFTGREIVGGGCVVLSGIVIPKEGDELPNMDRERFDLCIKRHAQTRVPERPVDQQCDQPKGHLHLVVEVL